MVAILVHGLMNVGSFLSFICGCWQRQAAANALQQQLQLQQRARKNSESTEGGAATKDEDGTSNGESTGGVREEEGTANISSSVQPLTDKEARLIGELERICTRRRG